MYKLGDRVEYSDPHTKDNPFYPPLGTTGTICLSNTKSERYVLDSGTEDEMYWTTWDAEWDGKHPGGQWVLKRRIRPHIKKLDNFAELTGFEEV